MENSGSDPIETVKKQTDNYDNPCYPLNRVAGIKNGGQNMKKKIGVIIIIAMLFTQFNFGFAFAGEEPVTAPETKSLEQQLADVTKYYRDRGKEAKITAPFEAMARFAVGETPAKEAFPDVEETEAIYHLKHREMKEEKDGEVSRLIFTGSTDPLGPQSWMGILSLDLMATGMNPSDFHGRNYIQELLLSQEKKKSPFFGGEVSQFTNFSENQFRFPKAADGVSTVALDTYWGGEWKDCGSGQGKAEALDIIALASNAPFFKMTNCVNYEKNNFGDCHFGLPADVNAVSYYNYFWLVLAADTEIGQSETVKNIATYMYNKQVGKTPIRNLNSEALAAYIIAQLVAKKSVDDNEWEELGKYQFEDGTYKLKKEDTHCSAEATALATIALEFGNRVKKEPNSESIFKKIKEVNNSDKTAEMSIIKGLFDVAHTAEEDIYSVNTLNELENIIENKYGEYRVVSSNKSVYDEKNKKFIPLAAGEPDTEVGLFLLIENGNKYVPVESKKFSVEPENKTFPIKRNADLLKEYYLNNSNKKIGIEAIALKSLSDGDEFAPLELSNTWLNDLEGALFINVLCGNIAGGYDPNECIEHNPNTGLFEKNKYIDDILEKQSENGTIDASIDSNIQKIISLEAYFGGKLWGNEKEGTKYGRVGAIENFLSCIYDLEDDEQLKGYINDGIIDDFDKKGYRTVSEISIDYFNNNIVNNVYNSLAIILLSRWLEDETIVEVNNLKKPLRDLARDELEGIFKTLEFTTNKKGDADIYRIGFAISAYVAAGKSDKLEETGILEQLRNSRMPDGRFLPETTMCSPTDAYGREESVRKASAAMGMALGDLVNKKAVLSILTYNPQNENKAEILRKDAEKLNIPEEVSSNITLIKKGFYGSDIKWESSNPDVINPDTGEVKTPNVGEEEILVTLTATLSYGEETKIESFYIKVLPAKDQDELDIEEDMSKLDIPLFISGNISLPLKGDKGSDITWTSSDSSILTNDGKVNLGEEEQEICLTATLKKGKLEKSKEFKITVFKKTDNPKDPVYKAIIQLRNYYDKHRTLAGGYWDVWAAKSVLGDDFNKYGFKVYDITTHKGNSKWAGTDYGAVILQILAQGDNPYNYLGQDWVKKAQDYADTNGWGAWGEPIYLVLALDAAAANPEGHKYDKKNAMGFFSAQLKDLQWGADLAGWSLIPMASDMIRKGETTSNEELDKFKLALKKSQPTSGVEQSYFNTGHVPGAINALSTGCVVSGFSAMNKAGIPGFDILSDYWKTGYNKVGPLDTMYKYEVAGKEKVPTQIAIEFGDVYYGDSVWRRVGITEAKLKVLLDESKALINLGQGNYSDKSYSEFTNAYDAALKVSKDEEKIKNWYFGREYFNLRDAKENLKEKGTLTFTIYGTEKQGKALDSCSVKEKGNAIDVIKKIAKNNKISITANGDNISELAGVKADENGEWRLYILNEKGDGDRVMESLAQHQIKEDTGYAIKYCRDKSKLKDNASLNEHLVTESAEFITIGGNINDKMEVTGDLELQDSGVFGTSVTWLADKLMVIDELGKVTREKNQDIKVKLTAKVQLSGFSVQKAFNVVVKSTEGTSPVIPENNDAYIRIQGPVGEQWAGEMAKKAIPVEAGETAYSLLEKSGAVLDVDKNTQYGVYIRGINGLSEFDRGKDSGWLYRVNGVFPGHSCAYEKIKKGDYVEWLYTRNLGKDVGGYVMGVEKSKENMDVVTVKASTGDITIVKTVVNKGHEKGTDGADVSTAVLTVKDENIAEMIKQAKEHNSSEIVFDAKVDDAKVDKASLELPKKVVENIINDIKADLSFKLPEAEVKISYSSLKEIASQSKGDKLTIEVIKVKMPNDEQKKLIGESADIFALIVKSGDSIIHNFGAGTVTVRKLIPDRFKEKKVAAVYIPEEGELEVMSGKRLVVNKNNWYEFSTSHFSNFALVDAEEAGIQVEDTMTADEVKSIVKELKIKAKTKALKKSVRVTVKVDKETLMKLKDSGYMVKYKYYKAPKMKGKYKLISTKKSRRYTDKKVKKGKSYYYKARLMVYDDEGKFIAKTSLRNCKSSKIQLKKVA